MKIVQNKTKIVATIGPASCSKKILSGMVDEGLDAVRFNFSHGEYGEFKKWLTYIREISKEKNQPVAVIQDLQGARIRLGSDLPKKGIILKVGKTVKIGAGSFKKGFIPVDYKDIVKDVKIGTNIFFSDGLVEVEVSEVNQRFVTAKVIRGGKIFPRKGIDVVATRLRMPPLTKKDLLDLKWGIKNGVDYVALSFVQSAGDVKRLRNAIKAIDKKSGVKIIAKIETSRAVKNVEEILKVSDGVVIARGDLGIDMPLEKIPAVQKEMVAKANEMGKISIVATQMMESMISNPRPTRAEVSDIANAVLDGADAVMLSGETTLGKYPIETVVYVNRVAKEIEKDIFKEKRFKIIGDVLGFGKRPSKKNQSLLLARKNKADCIVFLDGEPGGPKDVSKARIGEDVYFISGKDLVVNQASLYWGVRPLFIKNTLVTYKKDPEAFLKKNIFAGFGYKKVIVFETSTKSHKVFYS